MAQKHDNDGILQLNEKHIEKAYNATVNNNNNNNISVKVIMDCETTLRHKFIIRLGFKQYDVILTKEQSVLTRIMISFEGEKMQVQYNVSGYKLELYFHENGHGDRNIDYEIKR